MIFLIFLLIIVLFILWLIKLKNDLKINQDNILKGLAGIDALLIKKNSLFLTLVGTANDLMPKEKYLVKELFSIHSEIKKLKPRFDNSAARYSLQRQFDQKIEYLIGAMRKYPELKNNLGVQELLRDIANIEEALDEKINFYNQSVDKLNWAINSFPSSILAQLSETNPPPPRYER